MEIISNLVDFILHLDVHLNSIIQNFGIWTYLILFLDYLPGDRYRRDAISTR